MYGYATIHTELVIPHQGRWEKTLPTHPERGLLPFSPQMTLQNHQSRFQDEVRKLRDAERLPKASVQRGQGHQAHPQPRPQRERRRPGGSQAGFHNVNYSVANSAPGRGGRRESESEASHSGAAKAGRTRLNWGHRAVGP